MLPTAVSRSKPGGGLRYLALITAMLLGGCQMLEPMDSLFYSVKSEPATGSLQPEVVDLDQLVLWVQTAHASTQLSPAQALERISELETRKMSHYERFRYAALNQQLNDRTGWIRARDTLRDLAQERTLPDNLQQLAILLQQHNQAMINAEARRHQMAHELDAAQVAQQALEQKIQALTNLEQQLSNRKELESELEPTPEPDPEAREVVTGD